MFTNRRRQPGVFYEMLEQIQRLYQHLAWADERALTALRESDARPPKAHELYCHVLGAEHVWLARMREAKPEVAVWPNLTLEQCGTLARDNQAAFGRLLARLEPGGLAREVAYQNSAGDTFHSRIDDILMHVALHGAYHRGQVALLIREAGFVPLPTDYIALVRGAPAATRQQK